MIRKNGNGNGTGAAVAAPVPTEPQKRRMTLDAIRPADTDSPEKVVFYGPEGIGKSWGANQALKPVFIATEEGLKGIKPAPQSFPEPQTWQDILDAIDTLRIEEHGYKTLVIDTADWAEALCIQNMCKRDNKSSIADYDHGKGYVILTEEYRKLLSVIDKLRNEKRMNVIFLAHSSVSTFQNPAGDNYDRYGMKMEKKTCALLKEWADTVLFANYEIFVDKASKKATKGKAYGGDKVIHAVHTPAWDAKNRYGITEPIQPDETGNLNFAEFWKFVQTSKQTGGK